MAYDAKPTRDDVILNVWQERDRATLDLYLREGSDGQGDTVLDVKDGDVAQLFEDGFLKCRQFKDGDADLLDSAFAYALQHGAGALGTYEARLTKAVAEAEAGLEAAYASLDATEPAQDDEEPEDRRERLMGRAALVVVDKGDFDWISDARREDVEEHLRERAEDLVPVASAPAP